MDYKRLTSNITVRQFTEIAENWYLRLNNLKEWLTLNRTHPKTDKAVKLISEMINRMTIVSRIYLEVVKPTPKQKFNKGTADGPAMIRETGNEVIITTHTIIKPF